MSYESPITMVSELINTQLRQDGDRYVADIEKKVGFKVDKQELIRALAYDREQYSKGYHDAMKKTAGHWMRISPAGIYECSNCGQNVMTSDISCYKFCHGCGALMEEQE